jgi:iron complex outermembrane recepter protein
MVAVRFTRIACAASIACLGFGAGNALAQAQQADPPPPPRPASKLERVEVTGSNIKRTDVETAAPVQVLTREDLARTGANTVGDVITRLTDAQGGLSGVEFSGFTPGAATISLRGLGGGATLVLINGRRIAPYGITGFQETITSVNSLPLSAIDRIDILKDGASAIYGSEAIAGVVNIILRKDYNGLEASANTTFNQDGGYKAYRAGITGGFGDITADRYTAFFTYEHFVQESMIISENKFFPSRNLVSLTGQANQDFRSSYAYPGNTFTGGVIRALPGCAPANQRVVGGVTRCVLDTFDYNTLAPRVVRDSLFTRGVFDISANLSLFAEVGFSKSQNDFQFDPQFYFNNAGSSLTVPGGPYGSATPVNLLYRAGDLGPRQYLVDVTESRALVGLKGSLGNWEFDTAIGQLGSKVDVGQTGSILISQMEPALAAGEYIPGQANSQAVIDRISPTLYRRGKSTTSFLDFKVSTELAQLPAGPLGFAAGAETRREKQKDNFAEEFVTGDVFGFGALDPLDTSRRASSVFAEFNVPIVKTLETQLAARYDKYSVGGNSTTPKVGVKWNALPTLLLRGTYAKGFRVANPRETATAVSVGFFNGVQDPVRCPVIDPTNPDCSLSIQANVSGNPALEPETSTSQTIGFVFEPIKDVSLAVDSWVIKRKEEITNLDINFLLGNQGTYAGLIRRDATGSITDVDLPYVNLAGTSVRGVDFDLKAKQNAGEFGKLDFGFAGSYYQYFRIQPAPGAENEDYNGTYSQPRFRSQAYGAWESGPWTAQLSWYRVGRYRNQPTPTSPCSAPATLSRYCDIPQWDTFSLFARYKGFKNLELSFVMDNIFDTAPPFDYRAAVNSQTRAWSPIYHNAFGRTFTVRGNYKFW